MYVWSVDLNLRVCVVFILSLGIEGLIVLFSMRCLVFLGYSLVYVVLRNVLYE